MRTLACCLSLLFGVTVAAQVSLQFNPELNGRTVDGLFGVKILNGNAATVAADLTLKVKNGGAEVLKIFVRNLTLQPGINSVSQRTASAAAISFAPNATANVVKQSSNFPDGTYEYCFQLTELSKTNMPGTLITEDCFDYTLEALSPLALTEPYHEAEMCERRPTFAWQPVFPALPGMMYQLTVTEVKDKQNATEALYYNVPLFNQRGLLSAYLPFPPIVKDLDTGKRYAWQVTAYQGAMIVSRSEMWTFKVTCTEAAQPIPIDGFRNIENLVLGNYYVAKGQVLFAVDNPYTELPLQYSIACLNDPSLQVKHLPKVSLTRGKNNVLISLDDNRAMKEEYKYIMKIALPNGTEKLLRFIYKTR